MATPACLRGSGDQKPKSEDQYASRGQAEPCRFHGGVIEPSEVLKIIRTRAAGRTLDLEWGRESEGSAYPINEHGWATKSLLMAVADRTSS